MGFRLIRQIRKSFGAQVFVAFTALIFLVSVSFIFLLANTQYNAEIEELENTGKLMAEILAHQSRLGLYTENESMLRVPIESLLKNRTVLEVCLLNQDEQLVIKQDREGGVLPASANPECRTAIRKLSDQFGDSSAALLYHSSDYLTVLAPVRIGSTIVPQEHIFWADTVNEDRRPIGYVWLRLGKKHLKQQLMIIVVHSTALGFAFWAIAALIAFFLIKQIHQPIHRLTQSVKRFGGRGDCDDLPVEVRNEIGSLARAFQEMTDSLKDHLRKEVDTARELAHAKSLAQLGMAASKVTHEVGNLLNNMNMVLPMLRTEPLSPKSDRLLMLLENETDRTKAFISDFLQFARKPVLEMKTVPLDQTIRESLSALQPQANQCGIELFLDWPDHLPDVTVDPRAMYQAVNNLIKNSIEAVGRAGTVRISGRTERSDLVITVEDTGPGIEPAIMEKLFEPFFTTKGNQGTGLGLSIVQGIVQAHRGTVSCESLFGQGTRFIIRLSIRGAG